MTITVALEIVLWTVETSDRISDRLSGIVAIRLSKYWRRLNLYFSENKHCATLLPQRVHLRHFPSLSYSQKISACLKSCIPRNLPATALTFFATTLYRNFRGEKKILIDFGLHFPLMCHFLLHSRLLLPEHFFLSLLSLLHKLKIFFLMGTRWRCATKKKGRPFGQQIDI